MSAALQLDMFTPATGTITLYGGKAITTPGGAWQARWIGDRYGWVMYRQLAAGGWESWEPDLPYGEAHLLDRDAAEAALLACVDRYGDRALDL